MTMFEELKLIGRILQEAGKIKQYEQILEVQRKLLEMQKELQNLERENEQLKKELKIKENLTFEDDAYWINNNGKKDGPFCSRCWDVDRKLVRKHKGINPEYELYGCPNCE